MKVYRNHPGSEMDNSNGYEWFGTEKDALRAAKEDPKNYDWHGRDVAREFEFKLTKKGVVRLLNYVADYNDNG